VILLVILFSHLLGFLEHYFGCQDLCSNQDVCYADGNEIKSIKIETFALSELNPVSSWVFFAIGIILFIILTSHPIEFWRKTPYMFGNLMGVYIFQNIFLCPC